MKKIWIFALLSAILFSTWVYAVTTSDTDLIGYWKMDDAANIGLDSSSAGNNCAHSNPTNQQTALVAYSTYSIKYAGATNSYTQCPIQSKLASMNSAKGITFGGWVKLTNDYSNIGNLHQNTSGKNFGVTLDMYGGVGEVHCRTAGGGTIVDASLAASIKTFFFTCKINSSGVALYVNGTQRAYGTGSSLYGYDSTRYVPYLIGIRNSTGSPDQPWGGNVDEMFLINRTLTNAEITSIYTDGITSGVVETSPPLLVNATCTSCLPGRNDTTDSTPTINVSCTDTSGCAGVRIANASYYNFSNATSTRDCALGNGNWVCTLPSSDQLTLLDLPQTLYFWGNDTLGNSHGPYNLTIAITLNSTVPTSCHVLNVSNQTYRLNNSVSSTTTCFNITAHNVTLDCAGYSITYGTAGVHADAVYIAGDNVTVKNCVIYEGGKIQDDMWAINPVETKYTTIRNNTIITNSTVAQGIQCEHTNYTVIDNNTILTYGSAGTPIWAHDCDNSNITNNFLATFGNDGAHALYLLIDSRNDFVFNNQIITTGTQGYGTPFSASGSIYFLNNNYRINYTSEVFGYYFQSWLDDIRIVNTTITTQAAGVPIYFFEKTTNVSFEDTTLNGSTIDVQVTTNVVAGIWNFTNVTSLGQNNFSIVWPDSGIGGDPRMNLHWWLKVNVSALGAPLTDVNISIWNSSGALVTYLLTDSSGWTDKIRVLAYTRNNSFVDYKSNYTVNITKAGYYPVNTSINISASRNTVLSFLLVNSSPSACSCPTLNSNWVVTEHCQITSSCNIGTGFINITTGGWLNISGAGVIVNASRVIAIPSTATDIFRIRLISPAKLRMG